jgi:ribonucleoside-diphosphate reductase alpha chain
MTGEAYSASAEMAADSGRSPAMPRTRRHVARDSQSPPRPLYCADGRIRGLTIPPAGIQSEHCPPDLLIAASGEDRALGLRPLTDPPQRSGHRDAPTGTIGLVMDCDTTGIEPDFALVRFKLAGGLLQDHQSKSAARTRNSRLFLLTGANIVNYCMGRQTLRARLSSIRR